MCIRDRVSYNDLDEVLRLVREKIALKVILTFDD